MIARRLATVTASLAIALAGSAAVPSLASATTGHTVAKATHGVAWTGQHKTGTAWTGQHTTGTAWTGQHTTGTAWTGQQTSGVAWTR
jgi:hypothetical protein